MVMNRFPNVFLLFSGIFNQIIEVTMGRPWNLGSSNGCSRVLDLLMFLSLKFWSKSYHGPFEQIFGAYFVTQKWNKSKLLMFWIWRVNHGKSMDKSMAIMDSKWMILHFSHELWTTNSTDCWVSISWSGSGAPFLLALRTGTELWNPGIHCWVAKLG